ncbi:hypothetical protein RN001_012516 [Aquatica leii]|uniref:Endonuclease/exonuclease/phosphatase domain-containing protein n=1 Tax=Aquatica leii TaxID=1421715 RepID=A0AAN7PSY9_9COLE|nr:hypothetical protein RN001_012516 [Aquatica leii]
MANNPNITSLKISFWNCNCLQYKTTELQNFLGQYKIDVILLSETHLNVCNNPKIPNYTFYHTDRDNKGGGTGIFFLYNKNFYCTMPERKIFKHVFNKINKCNGLLVTPSKINYGIVWGSLSSGSTYAHTAELLSVMDIPPISYYLYHKIENELTWKNVLWKNMEKAGVKEKEIARRNGHIDSDGVPWITVYVDGGWSKRSYGHNLNALSGVVSYNF